MLPIYNAISYEGRIEKGGRTRPIIVTVKDEDKKFKQYVVKLYSKSDVQQNLAVARDVITVALASEFDLKTPKPAFIRLDDSFLQTLTTDLQTEIQQKDNRLKFGCELLEDVNNFNDNLPNNIIEGLWQIDTVFAFDNLVRNFDRRTEKTNLLLQNREIYLIDHEYCLTIDQQVIDKLDTQNWIYAYENHVFYKFLSGRKKTTKDQYFNEFEELLKVIDVKVIDSYVAQLHELRFPTPNIEILKEYLQNCKQNSHKFVTLLKGILQ